MPNMIEPLIMEWASNAGDPTNTIYGFVPIEVVDEVIAKHGGIANTSMQTPTTTPQEYRK